MIAIIIVAAVVLVFAMILMGKKSDAKNSEGLVNNILSKDALSVDFGDGKNTVVKFFGISVAHESEMQDEKINELLQGSLLGARLNFRAKGVANGDVIIAEVYTKADEYVNAILVRQGLARWIPSEAANDSELMKAQQDAKSKQAGVWNIAIQELMKEKSRQAEADLSGESVEIREEQ